jgi:hypothetical protein
VGSCSPPPAWRTALPADRQGALGSQNQAITKDTQSTVETIPLRSEIEEKKKEKQTNKPITSWWKWCWLRECESIEIQAGMYLKINNFRILSLSFDGFVSRYAGMPFPKESLAFSKDPDKHMALMGKTDYRVKQNWKEFDVSGATVIAQSSFWLANCADDETFSMYINENTIPRFRRIPRIRKREDLEQFVRTHLISNATGSFRYHPNPRQKLRFGCAKDNTDWHFMRSLYVLFMQEVLPLNPKRVVDPDKGSRGNLASTIYCVFLARAAIAAPGSREPSRFASLPSGFDPSRKGLRVRVPAEFAVTGCRLRERLAAPVAEIRDAKACCSRACRPGPGKPL